jgi:hypothetical protein
MATNAPAPTAPTAPAAPAAPAAPQEYTSTDDLFAAAEEHFGLSDKMPDYSNAKEYKDGTLDDLLDTEEADRVEDPTTGESEEGEATEQNTEEGSSEDLLDSVKEDEGKPLYEFKGKIGNKERQLTIKTPEQMDRVIQRAMISEELYKRNQQKDELLGQYKPQAEAMDRLDELIERDPLRVARSIIEDLPEAQLKDWLIEVADWVSRPDHVKQLEKAEKRAQEAERVAEMNRKHIEEMNNRTKQAAQQADRHTVQAWSYGIMERVKARIPEQYHGMINQQLENTLEIARARQSRGEDITIKSMDQYFKAQVKPLIDLINSRSNKDAVNKEVGRVMADKRQNGLAKVQNMAGKAQPTTADKRKQIDKELEQDPMKIFDYLDRQIASGKASFR